MGTITINVDNNTEKEFREITNQTYGKKKGSLGKALTEAMDEWTKKKTSLKRCMELLDKGIDMGKMKYKKREELHDRN